MNGTTNENELETLNGIGLDGEQNLQNDIDNAFSDLISEFFEEDNTTQTAGNITTGLVLDWDSVADGQITNVVQNATGIDIDTGTDTDETTTTDDGLLFSNLEAIFDNTVTVGQETGTTVEKTTVDTSEIYKNIDITDNEGEKTNLQGNGIYNELGQINTEAVVKNAYGVVTLTGEVLNNLADKATEENNLEGATDTENTKGTEFKLTQGNLPAKIGFWTKVRNFFIPESKLQYSVQQAGTNTGLWNKLQNLFSFGKNK